LPGTLAEKDDELLKEDETVIA